MPAPGRVIAAVSGGPDSTAMLLALKALRLDVVVAHVDHRARPDSGTDAAFVADLAAAQGCAFIGLACEPGDGSEDALRRGRYGALAAVQGDYLATGHTLDDQAETVLLRLIRGTGVAGLAAIPPVNGRIIRPLLDITRSDVMAYLHYRQQEYFVDPTNASLDPLRNRVRHDLLARLKADYQPNISASLARMADAARSDREYLEDAARRHYQAHGLDLDALRAAHSGLVPHIFRHASKVPIPAERMRAIQRLIAGTGGGVQLEGGFRVEIEKRKGKGLRIGRQRIVFNRIGPATAENASET